MKSTLNKTKTTRLTLPLVDFDSFSSSGDHDPIKQLKTATEIDKANRQHGFVCLRNSGLSKQKVQSAFNASEKLFNLDIATKQKLKQIDPLTNTGYVGYGVEALNRNRRTDLKEAFNFRDTSVQNGDLCGTPESFQIIAPSIWDDLNDLGSKYALCCALALGLERDYFSKTLNVMDLSTLRMLHYPPCDNDIADASLDPNSSCAIRVGEHTDFGLFTFLFIHDFHDHSSLGLQTKNPDCDGSLMPSSCWDDVVFDVESLKLIEGDKSCAVIVNTGALMARWTNDVWKATAHRVVVSPKAFSSHRYSMAMFFDPDKETVCSVHPHFVKKGEEPKYPDIKSIDYLLMKLKEAQGLKS